MNRFDRFLARHPNFQAFFLGMSGTFGIFSPPRYVPTVEESFQQVADDITQAIELARKHDLAPRQWRMPNGEIVGEAVNHEAVELLKNDPDEYFRRTRKLP